MRLHAGEYKLSNMCAALEISERTYYRLRDREDPDYWDYLLIKQIFDESKGTYGSRRIKEGLKRRFPEPTGMRSPPSRPMSIQPGKVSCNHESP